MNEMYWTGVVVSAFALYALVERWEWVAVLLGAALIVAGMVRWVSMTAVSVGLARAGINVEADGKPRRVLD